MNYPYDCSIVIPAYNAAKHIQETVMSALASDSGSIELIVVDDGSTDATPEVLASIANMNPGVRVIRTTNAGVSSARNTGLSLASAPFICFLDADDRLTPNALTHLRLTLGSNPHAAAAYGDLQYIDEKSKKYFVPKANSGGNDSQTGTQTVAIESLLQRNFIDTPGAILFRTAAVKKVGGFDQTLLYAEDWELYVRVACLGPFLHCGNTVMDYRLHSASAMNNKSLTHRHFEPALSKVFDVPAERYGISAQALKIYEHRMRIRVHQVIILKSKGLKTQLRNIQKIMSTLSRSNLEPALIKAAFRSILSATLRAF